MKKSFKAVLFLGLTALACKVVAAPVLVIGAAAVGASVAVGATVGAAIAIGAGVAGLSYMQQRQHKKALEAAARSGQAAPMVNEAENRIAAEQAREDAKLESAARAQADEARRRQAAVSGAFSRYSVDAVEDTTLITQSTEGDIV